MSQIFLLRLSSCSKSHLVQNPTLFKISPCSKSHLAEPLLVPTPLAESPGLQLRQTRDALQMTYVFFVVPNEWLYHLCPMSGTVSEGPMSGPFYVIAQ